MKEDIQLTTTKKEVNISEHLYFTFICCASVLSTQYWWAAVDQKWNWFIQCTLCFPSDISHFYSFQLFQWSLLLFTNLFLISSLSLWRIFSLYSPGSCTLIFTYLTLKTTQILNLFQPIGDTALISSFVSLLLVSVLIFNYLKGSISFKHLIFCLVFWCQENGWKTVEKSFCFYCAIKVPKDPSHKAPVQQSKKITKILQAAHCPRTQSKNTPLAKNN